MTRVKSISTLTTQLIREKGENSLNFRQAISALGAPVEVSQGHDVSLLEPYLVP